MRRVTACLLAAVAMAAASTTFAQSAQTLPRIHVVLVNEANPESLAAARDDAMAQAKGCRASLQLPPVDIAPPSDERLAQIVFREQEFFFDGRQIAFYLTTRFLRADGESACRPYIWVRRVATLYDGCAVPVVGTSGGHVGSEPAPGSPPWYPLVMETRMDAKPCARHHRDVDVEGLPRDLAHGDVPCIWESRIVAASVSDRPDTKVVPGMGPARGGTDRCLYAALPYYAASEGVETEVVLREHATGLLPEERAELMRSSGGRLEFDQESRLQRFEVGGRSIAGRLDRAAVDAFVRLPPRESL